MKNSIFILTVLLFVISSQSTFAQNQSTPESIELRKKQVEGYQQIILMNRNKEEVEKAKKYLIEMGEPFEAKKEEPKKMTDAEEQKKMSETLTPEQYNAWKAEKHKNSGVKPIEMVPDTTKKN